LAHHAVLQNKLPAFISFQLVWNLLCSSWNFEILSLQNSIEDFEIICIKFYM
jgi:hypothetical protein